MQEHTHKKKLGEEITTKIERLKSLIQQVDNIRGPRVVSEASIANLLGLSSSYLSRLKSGGSKDDDEKALRKIIQLLDLFIGKIERNDAVDAEKLDKAIVDFNAQVGQLKTKLSKKRKEIKRNRNLFMLLGSFIFLSIPLLIYQYNQKKQQLITIHEQEKLTLTSEWEKKYEILSYGRFSNHRIVH